MFASLELSKKLSEIGCVSEYECGTGIDCIPVFNPWDFIANTEQARKNAEIVWPSKIGPLTYCIDENAPPGYIAMVKKDVLPEIPTATEYKRHKAIDAPDFWEFIEESLEEK